LRSVAWLGETTRTAHSFDDPAAAEGTHDERLRKFREVRDEIDAWRETWLADWERPRGSSKAATRRIVGDTDRPSRPVLLA